MALLPSKLKKKKKERKTHRMRERKRYGGLSRAHSGNANSPISGSPKKESRHGRVTMSAEHKHSIQPLKVLLSTSLDVFKKKNETSAH